MSGYFRNIWGAIRGGGSKRQLPASTRRKLEAERSRITAKYDAAAYTDENTKHWLQADDLSARRANSAEVRATLRKRSGIERANNSYFTGMVKTFANEIIGTGPRLQLQTSNEQANRTIEQAWQDWCLAVGLREKLGLFVETRGVDGELFGLFTTNPLIENPVQLDIRPIEADQITTPQPLFSEKAAVDGIHFDKYGNPRIYDMLTEHPGGDGEFGFGWSFSMDTRPIAARNMLHYFRVERAGQARGVPDVTPALPLFAQIRRYTLAVLAAAELAASFAAIIKTDLPPGEAPDSCVPWETIDIVRGMMQTLPNGADISQFRPEQPVTTFAEFLRCLLREICRAFEMPYSVATGDGSDNSYSSGRLDVQAWERKVKVERCAVSSQLLTRIFSRWVEEASLIKGYLPIADIGPPETWRKIWMWDAFKHVDPQKESRSRDMGIKNGSITLEDVCIEIGKDWDEHKSQLQRQTEFYASIGAPNPLGQIAPPLDTQQQQDLQDLQDNADAKQGVEYAASA